MEPLVREAGFRPVQGVELKGIAHEHGLWPGISQGPSHASADTAVSAASAQPWVDANGFWYGWLKALHPAKPALLGYQADEKAGLKPDRMVPHDTGELALVEAWVSGGNWILSLPRRFRDQLMKKDAGAAADWKRLAGTARWLQEHETLFRRPVVPIVTTLVDATETTAEVANLMYRQNVSPALHAAASPPAPDPEHVKVLVAVSVEKPAAQARAAILAHAAAGATVVVDEPGEKAWWRDARMKLARKDVDRDFHALGRGQVVAYHEQISDVSEFAFDVIDLAGQKNRAVRMWNAPSQVALFSRIPGSREAVLSVVNYSTELKTETLVRVQGVFRRASLLTPDAGPRELKAVKRGATTEIYLPEVRRLAVVVFS
jgi:hypothetical protein